MPTAGEQHQESRSVCVCVCVSVCVGVENSDTTIRISLQQPTPKRDDKKTAPQSCSPVRCGTRRAGVMGWIMGGGCFGADRC